MKRLAVTLAVLVVVATWTAGTAAAGIRSIDLHGYPIVRVTLTTSSATVPPPAPTENGRAVQGLEEQNLGQQKAVVLAIDRSQSMRGAPLAAATVAAAAFVDAKSQSDYLSVIAVGQHAIPLTQFSEATIDADTALRSVSVDSHVGTALYDAVATAAAMASHAPVDGRVLILLTDGHDVGSFASFGDAEAAARHAGLIVYGIALGRGDHSKLRQLARDTGGRMYDGVSLATLRAIYDRIRLDLSHTWQVSYATTALPGDHVRLAIGGHELALVMPGRPVLSHPRHNPFAARWTIVPVAAAFGILIALAWAMLGRSLRTKRLKERVALAAGEIDPVPTDERRGRLDFAQPLINVVERSIAGSRVQTFLETSVDRAAVKLQPVELATLSLVLGGVLAVLLIIRGANPVFWFVGLGVGLALPPAVVWLLGRRRVRQFDRQLPVALETMAASLRAGHSLRHAIQGIATEGSPPASVEFARVLAEARLGRPLEEAMVAMCERLGSPDLEYVASAVAVQANVGGAMAGLFDQAAETVRQRQQHARRLKTLTSTGRASAITLTFLPVGLAVLLTIVNPSYMLPFFEDTTGQIICVFCACSILIGGLVLTRIVSVKA